MMSTYTGSGYFRIDTAAVPQIATPIGLDELSDLSTDRVLRDALSALYLQNCTLVSMIAPSEVFIAPGPLVYEAVSIPGYADGSQRAPINCQSLILKMVGKGSWQKDANGGPEWVEAPPTPAPTPIGQPGTGSVMPGAALTATDVYNLLVRNNPTWR